MALEAFLGRLVKMSPSAILRSSFGYARLSIRQHTSEAEAPATIDLDPFMQTSKYVNEVRLLGYVGQNPSHSFSNSAVGPQTTFSIATNKTYRDASGSLKKELSWHQIVVRDSYLQDYVQKYVVKGARTYVSGYLTYEQRLSEYERVERAMTPCIVADQVISLKRPFTPKEENNEEE